MVQATVMKWLNRKKDGSGPKNSYGFAVTGSGQTVFIPYKSLGGKDMRLQVGAKITLDVEQVEGHDGRVLGSNVKGPGVVSWDDWKESGSEGKQMAMDTKEKWREHCAAQDGWTKKDRPERSAGGGRGGGGDGKRKDTDGKFYTKQEFKDQYGGYKEWDAAKCTAKFVAKQAEGFFADEASAQTATQTTTWNEQTQIERRQTTYHQGWAGVGFEDAYVPESAPAKEMPPAPTAPTAPSTPAYTLPEGWSEHVSQQTGRTFYWHEASDTSQYHWPNGLQTEKLNRYARMGSQQETVSDEDTEWSNPDYDAKPTFAGLPEASNGLVRAVSTGSNAQAS